MEFLFPQPFILLRTVMDWMMPTYTETMDPNANLFQKQHHRHPEKQCSVLSPMSWSLSCIKLTINHQCPINWASIFIALITLILQTKKITQSQFHHILYKYPAYKKKEEREREREEERKKKKRKKKRKKERRKERKKKEKEKTTPNPCPEVEVKHFSGVFSSH